MGVGVRQGWRQTRIQQKSSPSLIPRAALEYEWRRESSLLRPGSLCAPVLGSHWLRVPVGGPGLPDSANKNSGCPVTFEFQINNK